MTSRSRVLACGLTAALVLLGWAAHAQKLGYQTPGYSNLILKVSAFEAGSSKLLSNVGMKHYPNKGLEYAVKNHKPQLIGQLAEGYLEDSYPELHVDENPSHEYSDVYKKCKTGAHCYGGKMAYQVKVHQDGDPAKYFNDFKGSSYDKAKGFIIPKEHREAARQHAIKNGRPDIAEKITDKYDLSNDELNEYVDNRGVNKQFWLSATIITLIFVSHAVQNCSSGDSLNHCLGSLVELGTGMLIAHGANIAGTYLLSKTTSMSPSMAGRVMGLSIAAVTEVILAFKTYGFTTDGVAHAAIGLSATAVGWGAAQVCAAATSFTGLGALAVGAACWTGGYVVTKLLGGWLWPQISRVVVKGMMKKVSEAEAVLKAQEVALSAM